MTKGQGRALAVFLALFLCVSLCGVGMVAWVVIEKLAAP
jgi:hypothetical protein